MTALPSAFVSQLSALLGADEAAALQLALESAPRTSVRLNPAKPSARFAGAERVAWCEAGRLLEARPAFTFDPLLHAGCYYVQEAASMFVAQAAACVEPAPRRVLDLCAAPGGKSTLWRSLLPEGSLLVANEPVRTRAQVLAENLAKWGHPDVVVTCAPPERFAALPGFFDVVAADVPCSGEGMFRKDTAARDEWDAAAPERCAARQWDIVSAVWPALREGGYLVYSTCTFNRLENEDNVVRICAELGAEPVAVPASPEWDIAGDVTGRGLPVARFLPHRARGEGFFLALLRKTAPAPAASGRGRAGRDALQPLRRALPQAAAWLSGGDDWLLMRPTPERAVALGPHVAADALRVASAVGAVAAGLPLAEVKGRKLVPAHELALSTRLAADAFPRVELGRAEALAYLRREAIALPAGVPRGYVVATHEGHPLGLLNQLGPRANNLYPAAWRIRREATDEELSQTL